MEGGLENHPLHPSSSKITTSPKDKVKSNGKLNTVGGVVEAPTDSQPKDKTASKEHFSLISK